MGSQNKGFARKSLLWFLQRKLKYFRVPPEVSRGASKGEIAGRQAATEREKSNGVVSNVKPKTKRYLCGVDASGIFRFYSIPRTVDCPDRNRIGLTRYNWDIMTRQPSLYCSALGLQLTKSFFDRQRSTIKSNKHSTRKKKADRIDNARPSLTSFC